MDWDERLHAAVRSSLHVPLAVPCCCKIIPPLDRKKMCVNSACVHSDQATADTVFKQTQGDLFEVARPCRAENCILV